MRTAQIKNGAFVLKDKRERFKAELTGYQAVFEYVECNPRDFGDIYMKIQTEEPPEI